MAFQSPTVDSSGVSWGKDLVVDLANQNANLPFVDKNRANKDINDVNIARLASLLNAHKGIKHNFYTRAEDARMARLKKNQSNNVNYSSTGNSYADAVNTIYKATEQSKVMTFEPANIFAKQATISTRAMSANGRNQKTGTKQKETIVTNIGESLPDKSPNISPKNGIKILNIPMISNERVIIDENAYNPQNSQQNTSEIKIHNNINTMNTITSLSIGHSNIHSPQTQSIEQLNADGSLNANGSLEAVDYQAFLLTHNDAFKHMMVDTHYSTSLVLDGGSQINLTDNNNNKEINCANNTNNAVSNGFYVSSTATKNNFTSSKNSDKNKMPSIVAQTVPIHNHFPGSHFLKLNTLVKPKSATRRVTSPNNTPKTTTKKGLLETSQPQQQQLNKPTLVEPEEDLTISGKVATATSLQQSAAIPAPPADVLQTPEKTKVKSLSFSLPLKSSFSSASPSQSIHKTLLAEEDAANGESTTETEIEQASPSLVFIPPRPQLTVVDDVSRWGSWGGVTLGVANLPLSPEQENNHSAQHSPDEKPSHIYNLNQNLNEYSVLSLGSHQQFQGPPVVGGGFRPHSAGGRTIVPVRPRFDSSDSRGNNNTNNNDGNNAILRPPSATTRPSSSNNSPRIQSTVTYRNHHAETIRKFPNPGSQSYFDKDVVEAQKVQISKFVFTPAQSADMIIPPPEIDPSNTNAIATNTSAQSPRKNNNNSPSRKDSSSPPITFITPMTDSPRTATRPQRPKTADSGVRRSIIHKQNSSNGNNSNIANNWNMAPNLHYVESEDNTTAGAFANLFSHTTTKTPIKSTEINVDSSDVHNSNSHSISNNNNINNSNNHNHLTLDKETRASIRSQLRKYKDILHWKSTNANDTSAEVSGTEADTTTADGVVNDVVKLQTVVESDNNDNNSNSNNNHNDNNNNGNSNSSNNDSSNENMNNSSIAPLLSQSEKVNWKLIAEHHNKVENKPIIATTATKAQSAAESLKHNKYLKPPPQLHDYSVKNKNHNIPDNKNNTNNSNSNDIPDVKLIENKGITHVEWTDLQNEPAVRTSRAGTADNTIEEDLEFLTLSVANDLFPPTYLGHDSASITATGSYILDTDNYVTHYNNNSNDTMLINGHPVTINDKKEKFIIKKMSQDPPKAPAVPIGVPRAFSKDDNDNEPLSPIKIGIPPVKPPSVHKDTSPKHVAKRQQHHNEYIKSILYGTEFIDHVGKAEERNSVGTVNHNQYNTEKDSNILNDMVRLNLGVKSVRIGEQASMKNAQNLLHYMTNNNNSTDNSGNNSNSVSRSQTPRTVNAKIVSPRDAVAFPDNFAWNQGLFEANVGAMSSVTADDLLDLIRNTTANSHNNSNNSNNNHSSHGQKRPHTTIANSFGTDEAVGAGNLLNLNAKPVALSPRPPTSSNKISSKTFSKTVSSR